MKNRGIGIRTKSGVSDLPLPDSKNSADKAQSYQTNVFQVNVNELFLYKQ